MNYSKVCQTVPIFCPNCGRKIFCVYVTERMVKGSCGTCRCVLVSTRKEPKEITIKVVSPIE